MPHHFQFDPQHRILLTVMEGDIDGSEIQTIDQEMRAAIARIQPSAGISDLTGITNFNVPSHIMRDAAMRQPAPFPPDTPRFIVAPTDFLFGMMRMYELIANRPGGKLIVVRRVEDALAALGVSASRFEMLE
jgi:hypothetical protein